MAVDQSPAYGISIDGLGISAALYILGDALGIVSCAMDMTVEAAQQIRHTTAEIEAMLHAVTVRCRAAGLVLPGGQHFHNLGVSVTYRLPVLGCSVQKGQRVGHRLMGKDDDIQTIILAQLPNQSLHLCGMDSGGKANIHPVAISVQAIIGQSQILDIVLPVNLAEIQLIVRIERICGGEILP